MARSIAGGFREEKPKPKPLPLRDRIDPTLRQFETLDMLRQELQREYDAQRIEPDEYHHSLAILDKQCEALSRKQNRLAGVVEESYASDVPERSHAVADMVGKIGNFLVSGWGMFFLVCVILFLFHA